MSETRMRLSDQDRELLIEGLRSTVPAEHLEEFDRRGHNTGWSFYNVPADVQAKVALLERLYKPASGGSSHAHRRSRSREEYARKHGGES